MERGQADAAVLQCAGADASFDRTIGNRLQVVVDGDIHVLLSGGKQSALHLGIGVVLVDIDTDCHQVVFLGSQQSTVGGNTEDNIAVLADQVLSGFLPLGRVGKGRNVIIRSLNIDVIIHSPNVSFADLPDGSPTEVDHVAITCRGPHTRDGANEARL